MVKLPYIQRFTDRHGKVRHYLRKPGSARVALPDPSRKAEFIAAYTNAMKGERAPVRKHGEGTIDALVAEFKASAAWHDLKPASKYAYQRVIEWLTLQPNVMATVVRTVRRKHVEKLRDKLVEKPATANMMLWFLQRVFEFGVTREYCDFNPAKGIKALKGGEYRSWTDEELEQFKAHWKPGTTERLIFALALYTGQRRGDLAKMTWADIKDGAIYVCQEKTGEKIWIPAHSVLAAELGAAQRRAVVVVATRTGRAFTPASLGGVFAGAISAAGLPSGCVLHGLRKAAARRLAEAGCSDREIASITGHRSIEMVSHYVKEADQRTRSTAAVSKLERRDREQALSNHVKPNGKH
jgi:integrase